MKTNLISIAAMLLGTCAIFSCQEADEPQMDGANQATETRAYGDKSPKVVAYVEINDTNPLNVGDYVLANGAAVADIVELFAANIHQRQLPLAGIQPTLYLNDKLTRVLEPESATSTTTGYHKYVKGLQAKGIKVVLTVLGDHQGIGVASMDDTQTTQFAQILAYTVAKYGLDGIGFDDEYADASTNSTSYSQIITKLRAAMPAGKLITVFDWGYTSSINAAARACIDYAYPGYFGSNTYMTPGIGLAKSHWSPMALNLGATYSSSNIRTINDNAYNAVTDGYGVIMTFNTRRSSNRNPLPIFDAIADGAFGTTVSCVAGGGDRAQDWTFVPAGFTITMDDVK